MDADFITAKNFDVSKVVLGAVRVNTMSKSKTVNISYGDKPMTVKVPKMYLPLVWDKDETNTKFTVELSFRGEETNEGVAAFHKMLDDIDQAVLLKAQERSVDWFKKPMNRETCEFMYCPIVKQPSDPSLYAPTFKVAMYKRNNAFDFDAFDENKAKIEIDDPHKLKGSSVMALIQCTGVWMAGARFGTTWKLKQIRVFPRARDGNVVDSVAPLSAAEIDVSALTFSTPKPTSNGGKTIYINSKDNKPLVVCTPRMHSPFGLSVWNEDAGNKFSIELSFRDADTDADIGAFQTMINDLEALVKAESATANWFKGAAVNYSSIMRQSNTQYPATIKFTVPSANNQITIPVVNATTDEEIVINEENVSIFKGAKMSVVASCTGVWSHGTRYGISFRALRISLTPTTVIAGCVMGDADEDEEMTPVVDTIKELVIKSDDDEV